MKFLPSFESSLVEVSPSWTSAMPFATVTVPAVAVTAAAFLIFNYSSFLIAQRIFVDLARPFIAHSSADGLITSLE